MSWWGTTRSYYYSNSNNGRYYYSISNNDSEIYSYVIPICIGLGVAGIFALVMLICCIRCLCRMGRNQNCSLLCRTCKKSCSSKCGYADVSPHDAILRPYGGIMENDALYKKTVRDNHIMNAIVTQIKQRRKDLGLQPHIVGSLKEKLGKPTRVITTEYPYGLPSSSPLCTDVDVMLLSQTLLATHYLNGHWKLIIVPVLGNIGYAKVVVPAALLGQNNFRFLSQLTAAEQDVESQISLVYLSAERTKEYLKRSLDKLNIGQIFAKSKGKFRPHKRSLSVESKGPAIKVMLRQQISCCTRGCMLGQCSLRLCCCMAECLQDEELDVSFEGDFTFGLQCVEWPPVAKEWRSRERMGFWPSGRLVEEIYQGGCELVAKSEWGDDLLWRYSFTQAEIKLINTIPAHTMQVLLAIKGLVKRENIDLKSYTLKTLMFWCLEESKHPEGFWLDDCNLPNKLNYMLQEFLNLIKEGRCRHYFIREVNQMDMVSDVPALIAGLERILANPYSYLTTRSLEKRRCCALSTLICRLLCGCHDTDLTVDVY